MDTGRKILNLRRDLGVQQKTLAELTSVTPSALSRIESGLHQPRGPVALRIARHLGVTTDYLLDDSAPYPPPARELLKNLRAPDPGSVPETTVRMTVTEKKILEALRELDVERRSLLEALLDESRESLRFLAYVLGREKELPGFDADEKARFAKRLARRVGTKKKRTR